jgi:hypothetical protein
LTGNSSKQTRSSEEEEVVVDEVEDEANEVALSSNLKASYYLCEKHGNCKKSVVKPMQEANIDYHSQQQQEEQHLVDIAAKTSSLKAEGVLAAVLSRYFH